MTESRDSVAYAFERMRQEALRRGTVPRLIRPRRSVRRLRASTSKGQPTGLDGRAILRPDRNLEGISALVEQEITARGWRTKLAGGWIHSHWSLLVGDRIAGHTTVEKFADKK